jgi:hypothetical protein
MGVATQMECFRVARHDGSKRMLADAINYMLSNRPLSACDVTWWVFETE